MGSKSKEVTGVTLDYISRVWPKDYCKALPEEQGYIDAWAQNRWPRKSVLNLTNFSQHKLLLNSADTKKCLLVTSRWSATSQFLFTARENIEIGHVNVIENL